MDVLHVFSQPGSELPKWQTDFFFLMAAENTTAKNHIQAKKHWFPHRPKEQIILRYSVVPVDGLNLPLSATWRYV